MKLNRIDDPREVKEIDASRRRRRVRIALLLVVMVGIGIAAFFISRLGRSYRPTPLTFDGPADQLEQTIVVPTLDSHIPEGKSAIWCASVQLAWNRLRDDIAHEPIQLKGAQSFATALNEAKSTEDDVDPESVFACAGLEKDNIVDQVRSQMAAKFPNVPSPDFNHVRGGAVAYAYLQTSAKYQYPFFDDDKPLVFTDSKGKQTSVAAFGIREKDDYAYEKLRKQVHVLYRPNRHKQKGNQVEEFVLDLCRTSQPNQIILARVDRKATLTDTFADVEQKVASMPKNEEWNHYVNVNDTVRVPNMAWRVTRRFGEIEGDDKQFANPALRGLHIERAMQTIQFRLDRNGAELSSEFKTEMKPVASFFDFDRPYLIIMKKRDRKRPFFVMWVDNAELLQKK